MGIKIQQVTICTCDLCGGDCDPTDRLIRIQVDNGDGRDVGAGFMNATLSVDLPYRTSDGIACHDCKLLWLRRYVERLEAMA